MIPPSPEANDAVPRQYEPQFQSEQAARQQASPKSVQMAAAAHRSRVLVILLIVGLAVLIIAGVAIVAVVMTIIANDPGNAPLVASQLSPLTPLTSLR